MTDDSLDELVIMAFDPGSNTFGVTVAGIDPVDFEINWIHTETITGEKLLRSYRPSRGSANRASRILALGHVLSLLIEKHNPNFFVGEDSFYGNKKPDAFRALIEVACMIESEVAKSGPSKHLIKLAPRAIKKAVNVDNIKDKESVRLALLKIPEVSKHVSSCSHMLDEHGIDSLAVFYTFFLHFLLDTCDEDRFVLFN